MKHQSTAQELTVPEPRLYMGPLKGFTDRIFRNAFAEHFGGYEVAVAPFISGTGGNKIRRKYVKNLLPENNTGMPVIPQILSRSAEGFIPLANRLSDLGYKTINWNLGCPHPLVAKKMRGSGLLPHTDLIHGFLDAVIPSIKGRLSIKTRLGGENREDIFRLIPILNQYPIEEIIIHPRTGIQMYDGRPDLEAFETCLSMTDHPIVYNGDIRSAEDLKMLSERFTGITRWMIGRWSLVNPFLPMIIKQGKDDIEDKTGKMKRFHDDLFEQYSSLLNGPAHILNRMKGLWKFFSMPFKEGKSAMKKIKKTKTTDQYSNVVDQFFDTEAEWVE